MYMCILYVCMHVCMRTVLCMYVHVQACSQVELWGGSSGPKWNSLLRKWPLHVVNCLYNNL